MFICQEEVEVSVRFPCEEDGIAHIIHAVELTGIRSDAISRGGEQQDGREEENEKRNAASSGGKTVPFRHLPKNPRVRAHQELEPAVPSAR